ncbi:amino acid ABC transporter ATP-binding protein [Enterococcus sp. LJL90]
MITLKNINKSFGSKNIIRNLNLEIPEGEILAIVGPSGGGKTTLLRILAGLESADNGELVLDGTSYNLADGNPTEQIVGVVFQDFQLFPHLNALENITLAPRLVLKKDKSASETEARELARLLGIEDLLASYPYQLSGGQKQRLAIARALSMNPKVLAYDEPTSALDPELRQQVEQLILSMKNAKMTQIVVTHDWDFAEHIGDQLLRVQPLETEELSDNEK